MPSRSKTFRPTHQRTDLQRKRDADKGRYDTPWRAWYGTARWSAIREAQLSAHPLCVMCLDDDVVEEARVCDHVTPHRGSEELFWSGPFQSLCFSCHNSKKQREERSTIIDINDINGLLD